MHCTLKINIVFSYHYAYGLGWNTHLYSRQNQFTTMCMHVISQQTTGKIGCVTRVSNDHKL